MSSSEPSAIVLQGIPCMVDCTKFQFEWRLVAFPNPKRLSFQRNAVLRSRDRSRAGVTASAAQKSCGVLFPDFRSSGQKAFRHAGSNGAPLHLEMSPVTEQPPP